MLSRLVVLALGGVFAASAPLGVGRPWAGEGATASPRIVVAPEIKLARGEIKPFPITIELAQAAPPGSWLGIVSLQVPVVLSTGRPWSGTGWRVPLADVSGLTISVGPQAQGDSLIIIGLMSPTGAVEASAQSWLVVGPARETPAATKSDGDASTAAMAQMVAPAAREEPPAETPPLPESASVVLDAVNALTSAEPRPRALPDEQPSAVSADTVENAQSDVASAAEMDSAAIETPKVAVPQPASRDTPPAPLPAASEATSSIGADASTDTKPASAERPSLPAVATALVARGEQQMALGNIVVARQFLKRAADAGSAEAALLMGDTYEIGELVRRGVVGVQADSNEARRWYEKARGLGAVEAAEYRLARLGSQ